VSPYENHPQPAPPAQGPGVMSYILLGGVIALVGSNVFMFLEIDKMKQELARTQEGMDKEFVRVKESSQATSRAARERAEQLKEELDAARRQASMAAGQAKVDAQKHADEVAKKLEAEQAKALRAATEETKAEAARAVTEAKAEAAKGIGEVKTEVGAVKTDVASTKSELDKTIAGLKRAQGDLSDQGSLIATNSKELSALKALGERNFVEFKLSKTKQPQRVGDIALMLKKTDQKKNRFTVEIVADDKRTEKKDRSINEPVQFYTSKARQPYEIVVNEVGKDLITGYLSIPKVLNAR